MRGLKTLRPLDFLLPLLALNLLWPILARYERPVEDRDFGSLGGGSADFAGYYVGSLAFIRGFDPYLNGRPEFRDPWQREIQVDGVAVSQYYLPGHYVAFAPLAWIYGDDWESASRAYFRLQQALLMGLAWLVSVGTRGRWTSRESDDPGRVWRLWALTLILFGLHVGVRMGLERGQSDVIQAVLLWGGVVAAAHGQLALAAFLLVTGTSFKGYGTIILVGLILAHLGTPGFRSLFLGALAGGLPLLWVTGPFFLTGLRVALHQAGDFSWHWTIHGFKHVGWAISPALAEPVRYLLSSISLVAAILGWARYRAARASSLRESTGRLVVAATLSLATMVGFSASSAPYNLVLVLPGLVWIGDLMQSRKAPVAGNREALFAVAFLLISLRTPFRLFAPAAYGLVLLAAWGLLSARRRIDGSQGPPAAPESVDPGRPADR